MKKMLETIVILCQTFPSLSLKLIRFDDCTRGIEFFES